MKLGFNENLVTPFESNLNTTHPFNEYPRPTMVRNSYINLNGYYDYKITNNDSIPLSYDGKVLVPFPIESRLSGVKKTLEEAELLFYRRKFEILDSFNKGIILLHLDGVDQIASVYVNGQLVGTSYNGYLPSVYDITKYIKKDNELVIKVKDSLNTLYPYGKQRKDRGGMWYTPFSGIWKSVWLESVSEGYIEDIKCEVLFDKNILKYKVKTQSKVAYIEVYDGKKLITKSSGLTKDEIRLYFDKVHKWTIEDPYLYNVRIYTDTDEVKSYAAFRLFNIENGSFCLNHEKIFLNGVLDQGYYSDGLVTPGDYSGFEFDIKAMKSLGYNALRKHIKVEPEMFYYYCDKLGMLVLQDFVNNGKYHFISETVIPTFISKRRKDKKRHSLNQKEVFLESGLKTMGFLYNHPSVVYYTIFNEGWGQTDSDSIYNIVKEYDKSRVIDSTSGWFFESNSDVQSEHVYFKPIKVKRKSNNIPLIISEFGGYTYSVENHIYNLDKKYGYKTCKTKEEYNQMIEELYKRDILANKHKLSGAIYTQLSDVEDEINGLLTYDRQELKVDKESFRKLMEEINKI